MESLVATLKAVAEPTRLKLLKLVLDEELCVCELVDLLQMSQPAVSQHLARLKAAGLVRERRAGMWTYYRADVAAVRSLAGELTAFLAADIATLPALAAASERRRALNRAQCCGPESVPLSRGAATGDS